MSNIRENNCESCRSCKSKAKISEDFSRIKHRSPIVYNGLKSAEMNGLSEIEALKLIVNTFYQISEKERLESVDKLMGNSVDPINF